MAKKQKPNRPAAMAPKGFRDVDPAEIRGVQAMLDTIRGVYERYGFDPIETPFVEYTEALGKFLPDEDRPNQGVFSFQDEDEKWLSLRYDLTAPLARYVAENYQDLPKPYRSYRSGYVFRNEKPGPGRFRQFMQMDADIVGASSVAADAEICMMAADTMEALGFERGQYVIRVNNRKVLDGVMEAIGIGGEEHAATRLTVLRAIDKLDKFGVEGVRLLLGEGRKDESGDFTKGAGLLAGSMEAVIRVLETASVPLEPNKVAEYLQTTIGSQKISDILVHLSQENSKNESEEYQISEDQINDILEFVRSRNFSAAMSLTDYNKRSGYVKINTRDRKLINSIFFEKEYKIPEFELNLSAWSDLVGDSKIGADGISELRAIGKMIENAGYLDRIEITSQVVRGLEYYTGPVFEAEITIPVEDEKGRPVRFGSVGGGGRYDGLVSRFISQPVPATGFSVGVSRLYAALKTIGKAGDTAPAGPVVVTVMDKERMGDYQQVAAELRNAGIRAEVFLGNPKNVGKQFQYADQRNSPCVIIEGSDERDKGVLQIKDLIAGAKAAETIESNEQWKEERPGQFEIERADLVTEVRKLLDVYGIDYG